jgi:hypothetical protein
LPYCRYIASASLFKEYSAAGTCALRCLITLPLATANWLYFDIPVPDWNSMVNTY